MPKLFAVSIALFLLLGAGYGAIQAARSIPWDCSDWQAFAHADRPTAILESLAENRGKTLYCGLDQSDTFGKAETWAAGKDRNERDDTVYWGERGSFRGFIAAQEGWLTEGESGITGQSIATIFEFPREQKKRRRKKYEYLRDVSADAVNYMTWYLGPQAGGATETDSQNAARALFVAPSDAERNRYARFDGAYIHGNIANSYAGLDAFCRSLGYRWAVNLDTYLDTTSFWAYEHTQVGGVHYARAQRGIRYRNVDCKREK